jgi:hypothetical protein
MYGGDSSYTDHLLQQDISQIMLNCGEITELHLKISIDCIYDSLYKKKGEDDEEMGF